MKNILNNNQLIKHMKNKGITFNIIDTSSANTLMNTKVHYFHLAAYRILYPKNNSNSSKSGTYQKLDFAYLYELSLIDKRIQKIILNMCLDIENQIKIKLISEITNNSDEDGYEIVKSFIKKEDPKLNLIKKINYHKSGKYCHDLIKKYYPYFPIWVLVELISFGSLIHISQFYEKEYATNIIVKNKLMNIVRDLRNACAHNNCLLNTIAREIDSTKQPDIEITNFIKNLKVVSKDSRTHNLHNSSSYSICTLLYVYTSIMPLESIYSHLSELKEFINRNISHHKDYFSSNSKILGTYTFLNKIIDKLAQKYNNDNRIEK